MKIGFVTTNLRGGGAEKALLKLADVLTRRGHEVALILLEHVVEHALPEGVEVHALTAPGQRAAKGFFGKRLAAWRLARLHRRLAQAQPFDLVVSTLPYADEVVARARLPGQVWHRIANTLSAEIAALPAAKAARRLARYRQLYEGRQLIAVSAGVAADLRAGLGLARARIATISNPFDIDAMRRLATVPDPDLPPGRYVIHVGRFARQKRHDLLFAAWKIAAPADCKLVLLAHADPGLDALIAAHGLTGQVVVAGFRTNPYPWLKHAALLVLCSDHEGMPNVLVEALACGTPVVSTDCPSGPREVLSGALARYLVPTNDVAALAAAMADALAHPPRLDELDLSRFDAARVAAAYEGLAHGEAA